MKIQRRGGGAVEAWQRASWGRLALRQGLRVSMTSPQHVSPCAKSTKNDVNDAEAIVLRLLL